MRFSELHILCLGANHNSMPLQLRERLAISEDRLLPALLGLADGPDEPAIRELAMLSTCNRVEIYAAARTIDFEPLEALVEAQSGVKIGEFQPHLYRLADAEAVEHLFKVSCGLDSLVLGEPQILGQVSRALETAQENGSAGALLSRLFRSAAHTGKRARAETTISRNPASISSWAASLCASALFHLPSARVAVLGAGAMAQLAVEALRKRGVEEIVVINRSLSHAQELARQWKAECAPIDQLGAQLARADILIASTAAPQPLVSREMAAAAMATRRERPLVLIDIAVPRNIDPLAATLPGVSLYNVDDLNRLLKDALEQRAGEVPRVEQILREEEGKFLAYLQTSDVLPLVAGMRKQAEAIRQAELERTLRRLPDLSEQERERIEAMTKALVKKLLERPTYLIKSQAAPSPDSEVTRVARMMFDLPGTAHAETAPWDKTL